MSEEMNSNPIEEGTDETNAELDSLRAELSELKKGYDKLKSANDSLSSENAKYKKEARAKLSEDELAQAKADEREQYILQLQQEIALNKTQTKLAELGFGKLTEETAKAIVNGDVDSLFSNIEKFKSSVLKVQEKELLKQTPTPVEDGDGVKLMSKKDFSKLSLMEKQKLSVENPEEYKRLIGG